MKFEKDYAEYARRAAKAIGMGGAAKMGQLRMSGRLNARERIDYLLDAGSFMEAGLFAVSAREPDKDSTPADGKVCGYGRVDDREIAVVSHDITVKGASSSSTNIKKVGYIRRNARLNGLPVVFLNESSGARIPDTMGAVGVGNTGQDPEQYIRIRDTPYASAVLGPSFGTACWLSMMSDFVVMRRGATLAISSPKVTSIAINQPIDPEELGGVDLHMEVTGKVDYAVDSDEEALDKIKSFLSYLPSHHMELPPVAAYSRDSDDIARSVVDLLPEDRGKVYDMRKMVERIADRGSILSFKDRFGRSAHTALGRLAGQTVGFVASNPMFKAGALDVDGCDKITSFLVFCDSFNIPVILLVDTPGFMVGIDGEKRKAPGKVINFMSALQMCSVPRLSVVFRKSYGQAYLNMGGTRNSDEMGTWFTADIGFMDPNVAVNVIHGVRAEEQPEKFLELRNELSRNTSAYDVASIFSAQHVIDPRETRAYLLRLLQVHKRRPSGGISKHLLASWPTTF